MCEENVSGEAAVSRRLTALLGLGLIQIAIAIDFDFDGPNNGEWAIPVLTAGRE